MKVRELKALLASLENDDLEVRLMVGDHFTAGGHEARIMDYDPKACISLSHTVNSDFNQVTIFSHLSDTYDDYEMKVPRHPKVTFRKGR